MFGGRGAGTASRSAFLALMVVAHAYTRSGSFMGLRGFGKDVYGSLFQHFGLRFSLLTSKRVCLVWEQMVSVHSINGGEEKEGTDEKWGGAEGV